MIMIALLVLAILFLCGLNVGTPLAIVSILACVFKFINEVIEIKKRKNKKEN